MDDKLRLKIERLKKSTQNVLSAKNEAQRDAAERFMSERAQEIEDEQASIAGWLADADAYINSTMPDINGDADHEYNREWLERLNDYQVIGDTLNAAWAAFEGRREAA